MPLRLRSGLLSLGQDVQLSETSQAQVGPPPDRLVWRKSQVGESSEQGLEGYLPFKAGQRGTEGIGLNFRDFFGDADCPRGRGRDGPDR